MAERRASLTEPRIERLLDKVDSKFTLVTLAARRAREINDYYNHLGEGLGKIVPPQVTSVSRKPLSSALEEIEAGKIVKSELPDAEEIAAAEAAAAADAAALAEGTDAPADDAS
ncbi:MAG: DNA-directed RNA polymerase subunit omega [Acidimicrobiia bacterium]